MSIQPLPVLSVERVSKHFAGTYALHDVSLECAKGEVRALVGANGSGKSTLVKVLTGYHTPEPGASIRIAGQPIRLPMGPGDFLEHGIAAVHQDLGLIEEVSVLENLFLYELSRTRALRMDWDELRRDTVEALDRFELRVDPEQPVQSLSRASRAVLALARAALVLEGSTSSVSEPGVLVLDEITAFLPRHEISVLLSAIRRVASLGHCVMFVSHDLDEVMSVADSVTVLRNGALVGTYGVDEIRADDLVQLMTGRTPSLGSPASAQPPGAPMHAGKPARVHVRGLSSRRAIRDVSFSLDGGEIVGLAGLLGSGFDEIPYLLFGAADASGGQLEMDHRSTEVRSQSPVAAIGRGIGLVPGDRKSSGLFLSLGIDEEVSLLRLEGLVLRGRWSPLDWSAIQRIGAESIQTYHIVAGGPGTTSDQLSGGNQQRVMLAKWLRQGLNLLLLHEPVQGVDVAARREVIQLLQQEAERGLPILCASSDHDLLVELCGRVLVLRHGEVCAEVTPAPGTDAIDKHELMNLCLAGEPAGGLSGG